jgi:hypothetical protein
MKRFALVLVLGIMSAVSIVFSEDAKALPEKTGEFSVTPGVSFFNKEWDGDREKHDVPDAEIFTFGFSLEYGFTDWFTAAFDWTPGWNIWSDGDGLAEQYEGFHDFSLEARFNIIGENAPVKASYLRLIVSPGVIFPFPGLDDEYKMGKNAWGFGGSVSFDTDIHKYFFLNVFSKFYFYPIENEEKVNHQWELILEAEPHFNIDIPYGMNLDIGLPVNFILDPEQKIDGTGNGMDTYILSLRPTVTLRLTHTPAPVEVGIDYAIPLIGKNAIAAHAITLKTTILF